MATQIVAIEFDQQVFPTAVRCEQWMRDKPEFQSLVQSKSWRLKTIAKSIFMSLEGRKVFAWHGPIYVNKDLRLEHPEPYVLVIKRGSSDFFSIADFPPLSARAQQKTREKELKQEQRDQLRLERIEKARDKKRKRTASKKGIDFTVGSTGKIKPGKKAAAQKSKKIKKEELDVNTQLDVAQAILENVEGQLGEQGFAERVG